MENRVALVTGSSSGIGQKTAYKLAEQGCDVVVNYRSNVDGANETKEVIETMGKKAIVVQADVSKHDEVKRMFREISTKMDSPGGVDILVNNAGIVRDNILLRMKDEDLDKVLDTNLKGAFYCSKAALRKMVKNRWGRIVNISSVIAKSGNPGQANYAASKAALNGFTHTLAIELGSRNITANSVLVGFVKTKTSSSITPELMQKVIDSTALRRFGTTEEIASAVGFLCSDSASYITSSIIEVDGGLNR